MKLYLPSNVRAVG